MLGLSAQSDDGAPAEDQSTSPSVVVLEEKESDGEAYLLRAGDGRVELTGSRLGLLRGLATLVQLRDLDLPEAAPGAGPGVESEDRPRPVQRGRMVDISGQSR